MGYKFNLQDDVIPRFKEEYLIFTWGGRECEGVFHFSFSAEKENTFNGKKFQNFSEVTLKGVDSCTFQAFFNHHDRSASAQTNPVPLLQDVKRMGDRKNHV